MAVAPAAEAAAARAGARKKFRARGPTWVELTERGKTTFTLQDAEEITGLRGSSVRTLIHKAERRGLFTRLRSYARSLRDGPGDGVCRRPVCHRQRDVRGTPLAFSRTPPRWNCAAWLHRRSSPTMSARRCGRRRAPCLDTSIDSSRGIKCRQ